MSEAPDKDQKTHEPTQKRLDDARKKGEVAVAQEMRHAVMFVAMIFVCGSLGLAALGKLQRMFVRLWGHADDLSLEPTGAQAFASGLLGELALALAPLFGLLLVFAVLILFVQGRPTVAWARLKPKWSKLSPISGLTRMFGPRGLVEFAKTLAKFALVITVAIIVVWPKAIALDQLIGMGPEAVARTAAALVLMMLKAVALLVGALALFDWFYQRRSFMNRMRMSLQELKDEHKNAEGDPHVKGRMRAVAAERSRHRMMAAVPTASVIITNPTHYAIALKYDHGAMAAPVVVAKGVDAVAMKIRELATEAKVPIVESPPLARALYASADIDRPIPTEHYKAVAEIIGYVMRLARGRG
ncbi:flagellar biosynthesis protein FlhB [Novosphingobium sp. M1R2S20]|uniref:Flagellar biosynthetic protein FlhB n=1 Tax=Novosphingobium rhizovicinum TaxID=3228928 RepID=A0ABV3R8V0_9SPHN